MGLEFLNISGGGIGDVLVAVYKFALGLIGISALVMFVLGAIIFMSAGDSKDRVGEGRKYMTNAVWGLVLALLSWVILYTINPDLVQRLDLNLEGIKQVDIKELPTDESGRPLGTPGSSVPVGRGGKVDPELVRQCPLDKGCKILQTGAGTIDCDCSGEFRGQGGF